MSRPGADLIGRGLHLGHACADLLILGEPLSLYGGVSSSGIITLAAHPQHGQSIIDKVVTLPAARGSSSSASVLAELIRAGCGPAALVLADFDSILVVGAVVAAQMYGTAMPIVQLGRPAYDRLEPGPVHLDVRVIGENVVIHRGREMPR